MASNRCLTSTGKGAPPETQYLIDVTSTPLVNGELLMAAYMVGTPGNNVGRFLAMSFRTASSSNSGCMMMAPPIISARFMTTESAKMWKNGSTPIMRSLPSSTPSSHITAWWALAYRLAWDSIAPFGTPVVPPVYCRTARSAGSISTVLCAPSLASNCAKDISLLPEVLAMSPRFTKGKSRLLGNGKTSCIGSDDQLFQCRCADHLGDLGVQDLQV